MAKVREESKKKEILARKKQILHILFEGRNVSSTKIMEELNADPYRPPLKSKATIKKYIDDLKDEGYDIISGKSGYALNRDNDNKMLGEIPEDYILSDEDVITEWLIMHVMSQRYDCCFSFNRLKEDMKKYLGDRDIKDGKLRKCLSDLEKLQYLTVSSKDEEGGVISDISGKTAKNINVASSEPHNKMYYRLTESAPTLSVIHEDDLNVFFDFCEYEGVSSELTEELKSINEKIVRVLPDVETGGEEIFIASGRKNHIPDEMKKSLEDFLKLPFKTEELVISYPFEKGIKDIRLMTGIIVYSVEKNGFYLVGESGGKTVILRFERIKEAKKGSGRKNTVYENSLYRKMFQEAWAAPADEESDVEIRFQDVPYVRQFVKALKRIRSNTANVVYPIEEFGKNEKWDHEEDAWIIYRDKIKGIYDFLPYIRSMGSSAVIVKPLDVRKVVMEKTSEMINNYKELHEKWENTQTRTQDCQN